MEVADANDYNCYQKDSVYFKLAGNSLIVEFNSMMGKKN